MDMNDLILTPEQTNFLKKAESGYNILVNACIGSGKTTSIQYLCDIFPDTYRILYLTYNKLLKIDAKAKITRKNVTVTNYHGFAFKVLNELNINVGVSDLIMRFNAEKPNLKKYDVLIIDEFQDIEQEHADMLNHIKTFNPEMQIIAVGDMQQKIYDKTEIDVLSFIEAFLNKHIKLEFTHCFRLSSELANRLGRIWGKTIIGVNNNCIVEEMKKDDVVNFLSQQNPKDILCLGSRTGDLADVLNDLEFNYPNKFNKKTVYASIADVDSGRTTTPTTSSAIFTTFDSSKGLERKICVVFDYTESYWESRISKPLQSYEILRNIFCVAASRGKEHIIFVNSGESMLSEKTIANKSTSNTKLKDVSISKMFNFKYKESIDECYSLLKIKNITDNSSNEIQIKNHDELIDLAPCIGVYQEAVFFENYDIDKDIELLIELDSKKKSLYSETIKVSTLEEKILFLTSLDTKQERYRTQVRIPFISENEKEMIVERLKTHFKKSENVQVPCKIDFYNKSGTKIKFSAIGYADVVKEDVVYELKFVSELTHEHFLQCACYIIALGLKKGILWNIKNNAKYEISIPDNTDFLNSITKAITKNTIKQYYARKEIISLSSHKYIAVIDTETTFKNEVMSIGVVIADSKTFLPLKSEYYVITPECDDIAMYSQELYIKSPTKKSNRKIIINHLRNLLNNYNIQAIFAYNAGFDRNHLPELSDFIWFDIMKIAANKNFNSKIPRNSECHKTGRLKSNYGVEPIYKMLSRVNTYCEKHNAYTDALDELNIMKMLSLNIIQYEYAMLKNNNYTLPRNAKELYSNKIQNHKYNENVEHTLCIGTPNTGSENDLEKTDNYNDKYYTVKELCEFMGKSKSFVYNLIHNNYIPATKINNKYHILKSDFEYYQYNLNKQKKEALLASIGIALIFLIILFLIFLYN